MHSLQIPKPTVRMTSAPHSAHSASGGSTVISQLSARQAETSHQWQSYGQTTMGEPGRALDGRLSVVQKRDQDDDGIGTPSSHRSIERVMFSFVAIDDQAVTRSPRPPLRDMTGLSPIHAVARYRRNDDLVVTQIRRLALANLPSRRVRPSSGTVAMREVLA